jgi:NADH-quinone oxidoreductase subunit N
MAGIPPLAGFFGKYVIFLALVKSSLYFLCLFGIYMGVINSFIYIKLVLDI